MYRGAKHSWPPVFPGSIQYQMHTKNMLRSFLRKERTCYLSTDLKIMQLISNQTHHHRSVPYTNFPRMNSQSYETISRRISQTGSSDHLYHLQEHLSYLPRRRTVVSNSVL